MATIGTGRANGSCSLLHAAGIGYGASLALDLKVIVRLLDSPGRKEIDDPDELAFAAQRGITNTAAMNLADADGDGYDDNIEFGCSEATATVDDTTPSETNEDEDDEESHPVCIKRTNTKRMKR